MAKKTTPNKKQPSEGRNLDGTFAVGNKLSVGNEGGRPLIFENPEILLQKCEEYFKWADENPWIKNDVVKGGENAGMMLQIPTQRPYTILGLCQHLGITSVCWYEYEKKSEFLNITTYVKDRISNQQIEGALVGAFNSNLTARIQGISENAKVDHTTKGESIGFVSEKDKTDYEEFINKKYKFK